MALCDRVLMVSFTLLMLLPIRVTGVMVRPFWSFLTVTDGTPKLRKSRVLIFRVSILKLR